MPRVGLLLGDPQPKLRGLCSWAWTGSSDPLLSVLKSCGRNLPPETEREVELDPAGARAHTGQGLSAGERNAEAGPGCLCKAGAVRAVPSARNLAARNPGCGGWFQFSTCLLVGWDRVSALCLGGRWPES